MKANELSRRMNADLVSFIGVQQERDIGTMQSVRLLRDQLLKLMAAVDAMQQSCLPASERVDVVQKMKELFSIVEEALPGELASPKKNMPLARLETLSRETYERSIKYSSVLTVLYNLKRNVQNATLPVRIFIQACEAAVGKMDEAQQAIDVAAQRVVDGEISEVPEETKKTYANAVLEMRGGDICSPAVMRLTQNSLDGILSRRIAMAPAYVAHIKNSLNGRLSFSKLGDFEKRHREVRAVADLSPDDDVLVFDGSILILKEFTSDFARVFLPAEIVRQLLPRLQGAREAHGSFNAVFTLIKQTTLHLVLKDFDQLMSRFSWVPTDQRRTCAAALHSHLERNTDALFAESTHLSGLGKQERHAARALSMHWLEWIMENMKVPSTTVGKSNTKEDIPA